MSLIRDNLMTQKGYTPYCGGCDVMPRTFFNGNQFECPFCKWESSFEDDFIEKYKAKWLLEKQQRNNGGDMKELLDKMLEARRDQMNRSFYDDGYSEGHELGLAIGKHKERERCMDVLDDCEVVMLREDEYDEDGSAFISLDEAISKMEAIKAEDKPTKDICNCDMRTKLVGDGCAICNPDYAEDIGDI